MIYTADTFIDSFKSTNTKIVETFFTDQKVSKPIVSLIEAQATFAKQVVDTATKVGEYFTTEAQSYIAKASKK